MHFAIHDAIHLTEIRPGDKAALIEHVNDREIHDHTLRIPFPYTEADADEWFGVVAKAAEQHGSPVHFAIRNGEGGLIGACGFDGLPSKFQRAEIGYWIAAPFRGRGVATLAVRAACDFAFSKWGLVKITACVFAFNAASTRVLEKCGFEQEGYLRKHFQKHGQFVDARLYALIR